MKRDAFSLLEIIIATAVLAASAMVLSSLIGQGSKFGNRAEERTIALSQAESLMDEFLAGLGKGDGRLEEISGELPGPPARGFRISATPFDIGLNQSSLSQASPNQASPNQADNNAVVRGGGLLRVTVELFETAGVQVAGQGKSLIEISRFIRQPRPAVGLLTDGMQAGAAQAVAPSPQGNFP